MALKGVPDKDNVSAKGVRNKHKVTFDISPAATLKKKGWKLSIYWFSRKPASVGAVCTGGGGLMVGSDDTNYVHRNSTGNTGVKPVTYIIPKPVILV